jgi:hypothetical protein
MIFSQILWITIIAFMMKALITFFFPFWSPFASSWKKQVGLQVALYKTKIHLDKTKFLLGSGNWSHAWSTYLKWTPISTHFLLNSTSCWVAPTSFRRQQLKICITSLFFHCPNIMNFINNLHKKGTDWSSCGLNF